MGDERKDQSDQSINLDFFKVANEVKTTARSTGEGELMSRKVS